MGRPPLPIGTWGSISRKQLAPGNWRALARFRDDDGVTRQLEARGATGAKAERKLIESFTKRAAGSAEELTKETRLSVLAVIWWAEFQDSGKAINTIRRYKEILDKFIIPGLGALRIREARVSTLDRFLKSIRTKNGGPTAKLCRTVLSGMLSFATRMGALEANPLRDVSSIHVKHLEVKALSVTDVATLRNGLRAWQLDSKPSGRKRPTDLLDVVDLMLATGARIGEVLAIRWSDVDLEAEVPTLKIQGTVVYLPGEGVQLQDHPKSATSRQRYRLPEFAAAMLRRRRESRSQVDGQEMVFPSASGTLRDPNNFRKQWRSARDDLGFGWVTPHTFRKSVATILEQQSGLARASAQLGHSSQQVTSRHYVQKMHEAPDNRGVLEAFGG